MAHFGRSCSPLWQEPRGAGKKVLHPRHICSAEPAQEGAAPPPCFSFVIEVVGLVPGAVLTLSACTCMRRRAM